jgi:Putative zinc-finger
MSTMNCESARLLLIDYVEHELDEARRSAFRMHLDACPQCRREVREIEHLRETLEHDRAPDPGAQFWKEFPERTWQTMMATQPRAPRTGLTTRVGGIFARWRDKPRAWVPALASLALILGLALFFWPHANDTSGIALMQAKIRTPQNLADLARQTAPAISDPNQYGFAPKPDAVNFFRIGHRYAEALAYAGGNDDASALQRLADIAAILGDPSGKIAQVAPDRPMPEQIAALEAALARRAGAARQAALFRAGGELMNLALAVAARDQNYLRAALPALRRMRNDLESTGAAPGALRNLEALDVSLDHTALTDGTYAESARLIREIQHALI